MEHGKRSTLSIAYTDLMPVLMCRLHDGHPRVNFHACPHLQVVGHEVKALNGACRSSLRRPFGGLHHSQVKQQKCGGKELDLGGMMVVEPSKSCEQMGEVGGWADK